MNIQRIVGFSNLAPFRPGHEYRPALDEIAELGGTLARAFCGPLPWCGQEIGHVYDKLGGWLDACRERSLHGYLAYVTEAGTGYALDAHVRELEQITAGRDNVLKEVGNEADHPSQGGKLSPERCRDLAQRMAGTVGYGATIADDEALTYAGGHFVPVHLNRGRDKWNMVRRVREIERTSESTRKAAFNQEPIGAAEADIPGKRESDPNVYFAMGALNRLMEVGGVFHSDDGLLAQRLGPNQRVCAEAFIRGSRIWNGTARLSYRNTRHSVDDAPFKNADLRDENPKLDDGSSNPNYNPNGSVCRLYAGMEPDGRSGFAVGIVYDNDPARWRIEMQHGYRRADVLAVRPNVVAWRVER